ncbi:uncharacterized protein [Ptychodera flava]|uniref:uncharacterized protein n=1 Tax=Ptychodera flava TaxID=63121 RepID=UPI003969EE24
MELYHAIIDAVTITLPWAVEQVEDALSTAAEATKKLFKSPMAAGFIFVRIRGAISGVLDAKKRIEDACFFTEGNEPFWFDLRSVLESIFEDVKNAKGTLNKAMTWVNEGMESDNKMKYILGFDEQELRQSIVDDLKGAMDVFNEPLEELKTLADPFIDTFKLVSDVVEAVKEGYADMKSGYEYAKSFLNKIFGSKSAPEFPKKIAESSCGDGFFPSEMGGLLPGIDLEIPPGETLVSPFAGTARTSGDKQVTIAISDEIKDVEAIIDHVDLSEDREGRLLFYARRHGRS